MQRVPRANHANVRLHNEDERVTVDQLGHVQRWRMCLRHAVAGAVSIFHAAVLFS